MAIAPISPEACSSDVLDALELQGDVERGRAIFEACAVCHMGDANGRLDGTFPRLAGQHATVIVKQLVDIRAGRRQNPLMLPYAQRLIGSQEIVDVALYISRLPAGSENGKGSGREVGLGERLYRSDCAGCHGARAEGNAESLVPALAGQHYRYMLRQIRDIGAGRRGNAHPGMVELLGRYQDAELRALVDYAARINHETDQAGARGIQP